MGQNFIAWKLQVKHGPSLSATSELIIFHYLQLAVTLEPTTDCAFVLLTRRTF